MSILLMYFRRHFVSISRSPYTVMVFLALRPQKVLDISGLPPLNVEFAQH